jgi:hypothetical protein
VDVVAKSTGWRRDLMQRTSQAASRGICNGPIAIIDVGRNEI